MSPALRQAALGATLLATFALVGTAIVALTEGSTRERIAANERAFLVGMLDVLVDPATYDNDPLADTVIVHDRPLLGHDAPVLAYRARLVGQPVALFLPVTAPDGYSGAIRLLVAIRPDGTLAGVRVLAHRETPGLGDGIEAERSDWIRSFDGRSLDDPPPQRWTVRKDGGDFDQFTSATITARAVVDAVRRALEYHALHHQTLWGDGT